MWQATNSKQFTDVLLDERESTDFRSRSSVNRTVYYRRNECFFDIF